MQIDLGQKPKADVKVGASVYQMDVPSVRQSQAFKDKMEAGEKGKEFDIFVEFIETLGMPRQVVEELSIEQVTRLTEGLMGDSGKK